VKGILIDAAFAEGPEARAVRVAALSGDSRLPIATGNEGETPGPDWLPVGGVRFVHAALAAAGAPIPEPINYPPALRRSKFLHRTVFPVEMNHAALLAEQGGAMWVKPAGHSKEFEPGDPRETPGGFIDAMVWASERVRFLCEWRCYVCHGQILFRERYDGGRDDAPEPHWPLVDEMVAAYEPEAPVAYGLDVGVLASGATALVEVNDGYALGFYGPCLAERARSYLDLLNARWEQLLRA